jgi:hypothetical protein|tara:strand:+ start:169 stop:1641 length:1473 start_codon:yes stop_codon:yes gene_type:complete
MAIEITEFAQVSISVSPTGVAAGNFGILGFLTDEADVISPAERARSYTSLASVGADWATSSEVYLAATAFYSQTPSPKDFTVIVNFRTAQDAKLIGGGSDTPAELIVNVAGAAGDLVITTNTGTVTVSALDLSGVAATYADMAAAIQALLQAEVSPGSTMTCVHNGYQFVIGTGVVGAASTISAAAESAAALALGLTQASAKTSAGIDLGETAVQALAVAETMGIDYVGLVTSKSYRDAAYVDATGNSAVDIAGQAEASKKIFCNTTNDLTTLAVGNTNVASKLKALTYRYSLTTFSKNVSSYPSAAVFGRAASVNFSSIGSTITLNLKQIAGVSAEDLTPAEFAALTSYYASAVVQIGGSANAYTSSRMASGSWLDTVHGLLWLENRCETDMFNLLYVTSTKIPYTQAGINTTVAVLERSLQAAVRNGLAGPGFLPDGTYLPEGYVVESVALADVPVSDKGNRLYNGLSFKMVGAGALHEVEVAGQFSE